MTLNINNLKKCDWLQTCRVNLSGSNLFTISGVSKFFDPETSSTSGDGYPVQRVYSIGVNNRFLIGRNTYE